MLVFRAETNKFHKKKKTLRTSFFVDVDDPVSAIF